MKTPTGPGAPVPWALKPWGLPVACKTLLALALITGPAASPLLTPLHPHGPPCCPLDTPGVLHFGAFAQVVVLSAPLNPQISKRPMPCPFKSLTKCPLLTGTYSNSSFKCNLPWPPHVASAFPAPSFVFSHSTYRLLCSVRYYFYIYC